jgi:site-specific recombinase XerD
MRCSTRTGKLRRLPPIPLSHLDAPPDPARRFRLLEIVRLRMRERRFSERTERAYVGWIRRYVLFHHRRHPGDMGAEEVRVFLSDLAVRGVAAATQNQALAALSFLYDVAIGRPLVRIEGIAPARRSRYVPVCALSHFPLAAYHATRHNPDRK